MWVYVWVCAKTAKGSWQFYRVGRPVGRSDLPAKSRLVLRAVTGTMPGPFAPHCVYSLPLSLYLSVGPGVITMCSCCCSCCCMGRAKGKGVCIFTPAYPPCVHKWNIFLLFPRLLVVVICIMLLLFRFFFFLVEAYTQRLKIVLNINVAPYFTCLLFSFFNCRCLSIKPPER